MQQILNKVTSYSVWIDITFSICNYDGSQYNQVIIESFSDEETYDDYVQTSSIKPQQKQTNCKLVETLSSI